MHTSLKFITVLASLLFFSCQNSTETVKLVKPVPALGPLPRWTQLADKPSSPKSQHQVKILTKFVEIHSTSPSDSVAKKLYQKTMNPLQVQAYFRQLAQQKGADIMTSPTMVTINGLPAKLEIGRELVYPDSKTPPNFKKEMLGVTNYVRARSNNDGATYKVDIVAQVKEQIGFHEVKKDHLEPVIETRRLTGSTTLEDGHSFILGGLMTEKTQQVEDKGFLTTKKRTETVQLELIAVVTVEYIDKSGRSTSR